MLPADAPVPQRLTAHDFTAVPLTSELAELDFEAYAASPDVIRAHSDGRWPVEGFTLADNLRLVAKHEADHDAHRAFTFTLLSPSLEVAVGCLYLNPLPAYLIRAGASDEVLAEVPAEAAMVTFWVRQDRQGGELPVAVCRAVDDWLRRDWPLRRHLFRVLPAETTSRAALEQVGLKPRALQLSQDPRPYLWYAGSG